MGASVAYHLASRGEKDILVVDRGEKPGLGSTGAATGGFPAQYSTAINIQLSPTARSKLISFQDDTGVDPEYNPKGYMFLAESHETLEGLRKSIRLQQSLGLHEVKEVTLQEAVEFNPFINPETVLGGSYCPTDGFTRPLKILEGYRTAAERLGVRFQYGVSLEGFTLADGAISQAQTSAGACRPAQVVNAAGPWARQVAGMAGIDLPVHPVPRHVALTEPTDLLPSHMPMTVFTGDGFHLRVRDGRVLLIWTTHSIPEVTFDRSVDRGLIERMYERAVRSVPVLSQTKVDVDNSWCGLYEMSPDKTAILGKAPGLANFFLINGSSGHGVMHSPALGELLAEVILDGEASTLDISALSPERFARGELNPVNDVL